MSVKHRQVAAGGADAEEQQVALVDRLDVLVQQDGVGHEQPVVGGGRVGRGLSPTLKPEAPPWVVRSLLAV